MFNKLKNIGNKCLNYINFFKLKQDIKDGINKYIDKWFSGVQPDHLNKEQMNIHLTDEELRDYNPRDDRHDESKIYHTLNNDLEYNESNNVNVNNERRSQEDHKDDRIKILSDIDYSPYTVPDIAGNENSENEILILDDIPLMKSLYTMDFKKVNRQYNKNIEEDFKLVYFISPDCGYRAYKYITDNYNKIKFAILDITLGYVIKNKHGQPIEIDGVDIAIYLLKLNPDIKLKFMSAHTLNRYNYSMIYYFDKFEINTNLNIEKHYIFKNGDRVKELYNLLYT